MRLSCKKIIQVTNPRPTDFDKIKDNININNLYLMISPNINEMIYGKIRFDGIPCIEGKVINYRKPSVIRYYKGGLSIDNIFNSESLFEISEKDMFFLDCIKNHSDLNKIFYLLEEM